MMCLSEFDPHLAFCIVPAYFQIVLRLYMEVWKHMSCFFFFLFPAPSSVGFVRQVAVRLKRSCLLRQNQKKRSVSTFQPLSCLCLHGLPFISPLITPPHRRFICFAFELGWIGPPALCRVRSLKSRGKQCLGNSAGKCTSSDAALNAPAADTLNLLWHRVWPSFLCGRIITYDSTKSGQLRPHPTLVAIVIIKQLPGVLGALAGT